jgi:2-polyprenyl-3-methyl-5-hydroxy-6-metoxy-1,4-benzoquinol methylase
MVIVVGPGIDICTCVDMLELTEAFKTLGDPTRLRILRLVGEARLNVSEVVSLVGVAQSSVSHHLTRLKALDLIREERQGGFTYYSLAVDEKASLWPLIRLAKDAPDEHGDLARLTDLLRRREDVHTLNEKLLEPGQSWRLWATALASLLPPLDIVDFGCGTGVLTLELARWGRHVTAIDRSAAALGKARAEAERLGLRNITFLEADLNALPLRTAAYDLVVLSQSLHHVTSCEGVLAEGARLLKPGGRMVVLELLPHDEQWVRTRLGHQHLGFEPESLCAVMREAGLEPPTLVPAPRDATSPFKAFLLTATRPVALSQPTAPALARKASGTRAS